MRQFKKVLLSLVAAVALTLSGAVIQPVHAQVGFQPPVGLFSFALCLNTNYGEVVAKVLGMTLPELRKAFIDGQTMQQIVESKGKTMADVTAAVTEALKADIEQAVKDGTLTQDEADIFNMFTSGDFNGFGGMGGAGLPTPPADMGNLMPTVPADMMPTEGAPEDSIPGLGEGLGGLFGGLGQGMTGRAGISALAGVKPFVVAATALNMKCADLVTTLVKDNTQSVATVAAAQKVDVKTVQDTLKKAYQDAIDQEVADGAIKAPRAKLMSESLDKLVERFVNRTGLFDFSAMMGGMGGFGGMGGGAGEAPTQQP